METTELRACVDCVHHFETGSGAFTFHFCNNALYFKEDPNYVTGEVFSLRPYCHDARESKKLCGPNAAGWEENPIKEPKPRLGTWGAFKEMIKELF